MEQSWFPFLNYARRKRTLKNRIVQYLIDLLNILILCYSNEFIVGMIIATYFGRWIVRRALLCSTDLSVGPRRSPPFPPCGEGHHLFYHTVLRWNLVAPPISPFATRVATTLNLGFRRLPPFPPCAMEAQNFFMAARPGRIRVVVPPVFGPAK